MGGLKAMNALRLMAFPARQYIPLSTNIILLHPCNGEWSAAKRTKN
jgi:hypothetical protein